jgi:tetratricopeptide (TPR) repeat protein
MVNQETISKLLQSASEFFKLQKYSEALAVYDSILSIDPINVEVFWRKGQTLSKLGKYEVALTWFDRALFSNSKNALIWNDKGIALFNLGNVSEAIDVFTQALAITPNDANILKNKDFALKKLDEQKQLKKSNDSIALNWHTKGIDYLKQEKYAEAITAFDEALKITPNDTILKNNKDLALKKRDAQNRLKDSNALALGLNNSGNGYFKQGKYAEAINEYNQALRLTPNNKTIKNNRDNAQKNLEKSKTKPFQIPSVVGYVILLIFISGAFGLIFQHSNLIQQTDQASSSNQQTIPTLVTPGDVHPGIILEPTSTIDATTDAFGSHCYLQSY